MVSDVRLLALLGLLSLAMTAPLAGCKKTLFGSSGSNDPAKRGSEASPNELDAEKNSDKGDPSPNELDATGNPIGGTPGGDASGVNGGAPLAGGGHSGVGGLSVHNPLTGQTGTGSNTGTGAGQAPGGGPPTGGTPTGGALPVPDAEPFPPNPTTPPTGWDGSSTPCGPRFQTVTTVGGGTVQVDVGYHPITPIVIVRQDPKDSTCITYVRASTSSGGTAATTLVREGQGLRFAKARNEVSTSNPARYCQDTSRGLTVGAAGTPFSSVSPSPASGTLAAAAPNAGVCVARKTNGAGAPSSDLAYYILIP